MVLPTMVTHRLDSHNGLTLDLAYSIPLLSILHFTHCRYHPLETKFMSENNIEYDSSSPAPPTSNTTAHRNLPRRESNNITPTLLLKQHSSQDLLEIIGSGFEGRDLTRQDKTSQDKTRHQLLLAVSSTISTHGISCEFVVA
jgi:hypothetical protein